MPREGISTEWLEAREDDIAQILTAQEHVRRMRRMVEVLTERQMITWQYALDAYDSLDYIGGALLVGKINTAKLRKVAR